MKKSVSLILALLLIFALFGCSKNTETETTSNTATSETTETTEKVTSAEVSVTEKNWNKEEIKKLFSENEENKDCNIVDYAVTEDSSYDIVGIVLYYDSENVPQIAFVNSDGYCTGCGIPSKPFSEPDLKYCGDGVVTFKLQSDDGGSYICKVTRTISDDGTEAEYVIDDNID